MEELSKRIVELQERHVKVVEEFETRLAEAIRKCEVIEEKHYELLKEKEEQGNTINSLRGEIHSFMNEKSLQIEHSTIAEEERSALVDIAKRIDVLEKPKPSEVINGNQNIRNVDEKPKVKEVNETKGAQENRKPINGGYQTRTPNKLRRKRK